MNGNLSHEKASALAIETIREIGKTYGRIIFRQTVMLDLQLVDIEAGIEAAVADTRAILVAGGICEHDMEVALDHLRLSIIREGQRLAAMLPEHEHEVRQ